MTPTLLTYLLILDYLPVTSDLLLKTGPFDVLVQLLKILNLESPLQIQPQTCQAQKVRIVRSTMLHGEHNSGLNITPDFVHCFITFT